MPADALFDLASCTKVVGTTTAILLLVDDGKLRLDDPVAMHVPEWALRAGEGILVRHLLGHTSGLPAYTALDPIQKKYGPGPNPDALIAAIAGLKLRNPPGRGVEYS
jgi:CubicO group peptidase (beta-lactamase class C family)